jgi:F-type H+-transporting ATPase subunit gamma
VEPVNYTFKPDQANVLNELVPSAIDIRFYVACLHSRAGEFGAQMAAMDNATRNAGEMIDSLTLNMNRVRQAAITNELVEIISGAAAIQ